MDDPRIERRTQLFKFKYSFPDYDYSEYDFTEGLRKNARDSKFEYFRDNFINLNSNSGVNSSTNSNSNLISNLNPLTNPRADFDYTDNYNYKYNDNINLLNNLKQQLLDCKTKIKKHFPSLDAMSLSENILNFKKYFENEEKDEEIICNIYLYLCYQMQISKISQKEKKGQINNKQNLEENGLIIMDNQILLKSIEFLDIYHSKTQNCILQLLLCYELSYN